MRLIDRAETLAAKQRFVEAMEVLRSVADEGPSIEVEELAGRLLLVYADLNSGRRAEDFAAISSQLELLRKSAQDRSEYFEGR